MNRSIKHGHARTNNHTRVYNAWRGMRRRCDYQSSPSYHLYGGRGITVCKRWNSFENFLADMGEPPIGASLDRYPNNNGDYKPSNCRWASPKEQSTNRRDSRIIKYNGISLCLRDWERKLSLGYGTIWRRLNRGDSVERAMRGAYK